MSFSNPLNKVTSPGVIQSSGGLTPNGNVTVPNPTYTYGSSGAGAWGGTINLLDGLTTQNNLVVVSKKDNVMSWDSEIDGSGEIVLHFFETENGVRNRATLEMDGAMSPIDALKINMLISAVGIRAAAGIDVMDARPISYIRKHNLERHFRITPA